MPEHTTDVSAVLVAYEDPGKPFPEDKTEDYRALVGACGGARYMDTPPARDAAAVYAVLSFSKNRSGRTLPVPFLWKRAYSQFIPAEKLAPEAQG